MPCLFKSRHIVYRTPQRQAQDKHTTHRDGGPATNPVMPHSGPADSGVTEDPGSHLEGPANGAAAADQQVADGSNALLHGRVSQIMNLVNLAPDIQEAILFLPRTPLGRAPIILWDLQPIASTLDWRKQRRKWLDLQDRPSH